ncbi:MAG: sigma-54-dependent Fis family transcriptional regulator [Roseivirga sp.]|nr:sigma-54-dependent Fis family transcriptional regulator [Roseivirga sp.]
MRKEQGRILIVDDDEDILLTGEIVLKQKFTHIKTASHPEKVKELATKEAFDVILLDMNYKPGDNSGKEGLDWIEKITRQQLESKIVVITAYGDVNIAVEAMKRGAIDFVTKPWEYEKIQATVMNALRLAKSQKEVAYLKTRQQGLKDTISAKPADLIGSSAVMKRIFKTIEKVARTDANVLILGENGTGKGMVARAIHAQSPRTVEVFMPVDLGSLSESLFESELFGHKKGAFTDAREDRMGRFEAADGGTVFLDEIGNLSPAMQSKLLTVLQNEEVIRIGENKARKYDARVIAATNAKLAMLIEEGDFREDLYYRLNTIEIEIPPLRERAEDIPELVGFFLKKYGKKYQRPGLNISEAALKKMMIYRWPGNIRELEHALERAIIMAESDILGADDFLLKKASNATEAPATTNLEELEEATIRRVVDKHQGNMSKVAKELGIGRTTLYRKLEKYGI